MAVARFRVERFYRCLSTDIKPTNPAHDRLYETDTGIHYAWSGSAWVIYQEP